MASTVKFTDGTTTLVFDGTTDGKVVKYDILTPELNVLSVSKVTRDGEDIIAQSYRDVVETLDLYISGTWSQIITKIRTLNRMWERVRRYQDSPIESPVYIEVKPDGDSDYWRSILKSVSTDLEPAALDLFLGQGKVVFTLMIKRAYYWETESEVELSLYNPGQSKGTGGKSVNNCNDTNGAGADRYNYLDIDNSDLTGDLPSRLRLKMTNTYNDATRLAKLMVGLMYKSGPDVSSFGHVIEGETTTYGTQKPASADYTSFSEGYYRELSWTGASEQVIGRWVLTSAMLAAAKSGYFMLYAKIWTTKSDLYVRPKITAVGGLTTLWTGPQVLCPNANELLCLGPVQLPPIRQIAGTPFPEAIDLTAQCSSGDSTLNVDYLLLLPMDRWRQILQNQYGCDYNVYIVDDGPGERLYTDGWGTAGHLYNFVGYGPWIEISPTPETSGRHRMYFFMQGGSYCPVARTLTVQAWYRPRRKQI